MLAAVHRKHAVSNRGVRAHHFKANGAKACGSLLPSIPSVVLSLTAKMPFESAADMPLVGLGLWKVAKSECAEVRAVTGATFDLCGISDLYYHAGCIPGDQGGLPLPGRRE